MSERRDFKAWTVDLAYDIQQGCCAKCGASLEKGFEIHHKDGNPSNISIDNIELLCVRCHKSTFASTDWEAYRKRLEKILNDIDRILELAFNGQLSGAVADKMVELEKVALKLTRELYGIYDSMHKPPVTVILERKFAETKILQQMFLEGWKQGIADALSLLKGDE